MTQPEDILSAIKVPTHQLTSQQIQAVLLETKRNQNFEHNQIYWNDVLQKLWHHITSGLNKFDDQLLCATCFYSVLSNTDKQGEYLEDISHIISHELSLKENSNESSNTVLAISLMYGIFQSSYLTQKDDFSNIETTLQAIFKLLTLLAYEYSKYTFIAFKIITSFKKICGTVVEQIIFCKENQITLLNVTNHNWENPITGVRDLNKDIFRTLISVLDKDIYDVVTEEVNTFYWNKAKYLMLAEIIEHSESKEYNSRHQQNWVQGLINSLHKPGLVSAGTDMYHSVLNKIKSENEWCDIFLNDLMNIFNGVSAKAIENFSNYWCLTTLKRFPSLARVLLDELDKAGDTEHKLYSTLHVIKQANKLGLITKNWKDNTSIEKTVLTGLDHCKSQIRILAFETLCISHCKSLPTKIEYELIMKFLHNNVNSDCTVLRISMLNSFGNFLTQIHINLINNANNSDESTEKDLYDFCTKLQELIMNCLNVNGNYQRKITVIKIAKYFLRNLSEVPNKRKKQTRHANKSITEILDGKGLLTIMEEKFLLKLVDLLNDHSEDIRENVIELLLDHYSKHIEKEVFINNLIKSALGNVGSKFFFDINCGLSMFKLISSILLMNQCQGTFKGIEDLIEFVWKEFVLEYKLRRGIVESIETGKQLHSLMSILRVVLEVCYKQSAGFWIPESCHLNECLEALNDISAQFAWEDNNSTSSDFSKMSDMVESLINNSGFKSRMENDETKISGLHQIVLNCLWLNIRASCELSSLIIQYQKEDTQAATVRKCFSIITRVLETCRHKGAIEAAGVSLGQAIRYLTSISDDNKLSHLPMDLLKCKLNELISESEASKMASVTRRGAGLSIMVHKIVSNDMKKGKPLFHYFMNTLLETCNMASDFPIGLDNTENEKDLPKAIYIHFLTKIVHDSSLASDMMFYSAELAELAFGNLTSPHWQIRNAALQMYGALVPKLIGQKKPSGTDDETIATVACDEFRTHSPKLWKFILRELNHEIHEEKIQKHSNFIPVLNMLANMARRYKFSYDSTEKDDLELLESLISLLDSPIYTARRLTAKCIFNIYSLKTTYYYCKIMMQENFTENSLHGNIMLMKLYHKLFEGNSLHDEDFKSLERKFSDILRSGKHSYMSRALFEEICYHHDTNIDLRRTFKEVDDNVHAPGIFLWANGQVEKYINGISGEELHKSLELILDRNDYEVYGEAFLKRILNDASLTKEVLLKVTNILIECHSKWNSCVTWKILYHISQQIDLTKHISVSTIMKYLEDKQYPYKLRYSIPLIAKIGPNQGDGITICTVVHSLTDAETNDVDMRYIAAEATNELSEKFSDLTETAKCYVLLSAIKLLQDEDEDIRNVVVNLYKIISNSIVAPHPYICVTQILDYKFLKNHLPHLEVKELCNQLTKYCNENSNCTTVDEYNPFANDSKNIYLEVDILKQLVDNVTDKLNSLYK